MEIKQLKIDNWMLVIFIIIAITFGFALGMFLTNSSNSDTYRTEYWNQQTLTSYILRNHIVIDGMGGGGTGRVFYTMNDTDFMIKCHQSILGQSLKECCKQGSVIWTVKYATDGFTWNNVTYNNCNE